jgi:hypothetical protein
MNVMIHDEMELNLKIILVNYNYNYRGRKRVQLCRRNTYKNDFEILEHEPQT